MLQRELIECGGQARHRLGKYSRFREFRKFDIGQVIASTRYLSDRSRHANKCVSAKQSAEKGDFLGLQPATKLHQCPTLRNPRQRRIMSGNPLRPCQAASVQNSFFCIRNTRWTPGRAGGRTPGDDIFSGCFRSLDVCARLARSMAAAASRARNRRRRQCRHVVGGRRTAEGAGRIWRLARRRVAGLHAGNAGLWHRRRHHRPFGRPVRHRAGDRHRNPLAAVRLSCRRALRPRCGSSRWCIS